MLILSRKLARKTLILSSKNGNTSIILPKTPSIQGLDTFQTNYWQEFISRGRRWGFFASFLSFFQSTKLFMNTAQTTSQNYWYQSKTYQRNWNNFLPNFYYNLVKNLSKVKLDDCVYSHLWCHFWFHHTLSTIPERISLSQFQYQLSIFHN